MGLSSTAIAEYAGSCELNDEILKQKFPHCKEKIQWMEQGWKTHACYKESGVDGSRCSFIIYLSEFENWCPKFSWRPTHINPFKEQETAQAHIQTDLKGLLHLLNENTSSHNYDWIKNRLTTMWPSWTRSIQSLIAKNKNLTDRKQKRILLHLGLLSHKGGGFKLGDLVNKGGPLGELVQWSDMLACLYILGHELKVTSETEQLQIFMKQFIHNKSPCSSRSQLPLDLVYTDILGLKQFKRAFGGAVSSLKCKLRIIDSFGTEPAFNHEKYAKANNFASIWAKNNLIPQQFYTMFPHTPDNSFMGFVVEQPTNRSLVSRKKWAIIYGKDERFWQGKAQYLSVIQQFAELHGTVYNQRGKAFKYVPNSVKNHGLLTPKALRQLLWESKIFVGLGFPYEGPAPLEAIASGCVFINPKFSPPHSSLNTKFLKGKPTLREVSSQHPYAQQHIGEPYVYTIDIQNTDELKKALGKILKQPQIEPHLPYEFTEEGMLQRVNYYLEKQDFCTDSIYVPQKSIRVIMGETGISCKDLCQSKGYVCEPSYFSKINEPSDIKLFMKDKTTSCKVEQVADILSPAYRSADSTCQLQSDRLLFSCVGSSKHVNRLCPCRTFQKGQVALCEGCT